ncbi:MAG: MoaD/ThiS family protein [Gammaproteobacteria bacterium]|nr:MoaD/ThiS family protein [Gammaproteobacteria bacterium]
MAHVTLIGNLRNFTGGVASVEVEARSIGRLLSALGERFPELAPHLESGIAVAIDGQIYQDDLIQPIPPGAEVHVLPQIAGG